LKAKFVFICFLLILFTLLLSACSCTANIEQNVPPGALSLLPNDSDVPDQIEASAVVNDDYLYSAEYAGFGNDEDRGGTDGNVPLLIEINENIILFGGIVITIDELENILIEHSNGEYVWELRDVNQAAMAVYAAVLELFSRHNISFMESSITP